MTKLTIVTDRRGKLLGAVQGRDLSQRVGEVQAAVSFGPGHKLHTVDADIDFAEITDPKELEKSLADSFQKPREGQKRKARGKNDSASAGRSLGGRRGVCGSCGVRWRC